MVEIAQDVVWPSTTAAALFAGLALVLEKPGISWIEDGLLAIDQITEGYNHIRTVCQHLLLNAAMRLPDQSAVLIRSWVTALEHHRGRDAGEVWAVMEAGISLLYAQFGESFVGTLWQELAAARDLFSG